MINTLNHCAAYLGQLVKCKSADREVAGSIPGRTNAQGLNITEDEGAALAMASANC